MMDCTVPPVVKFVVNVLFIPYFRLLVVGMYFGQFSCLIVFPFFPRLAHLALKNLNKDYVIHIFVFL